MNIECFICCVFHDVTDVFIYVCCVCQHSKAFFDVHLMVSEPDKWVKDMKEAGADMFTFHIEATKDSAATKAIIKKIQDANMKVGIALKPGTAADAVFDYGKDVDLLLVMTVEPGFGGQKFMEDMMPKVSCISSLSQKPSILPP